MAKRDLVVEKNRLLVELIEVALKKNMPRRSEKIEEVHKRINALIRYEQEFVDVAAPVAARK